MAPSFLSLPLEIRMNVYEELLISPLDWAVPGVKPFLAMIPRCGRRLRDEYNLHPAILRVCRSVYLEALPILYGKNAYYDPRAGRPREHCYIIPTHHLMHIRDIAISRHYTGPTSAMPGDLKDLLRRKTDFDTVMLHIKVTPTPDDEDEILEIVDTMNAFNIKTKIDVVVSDSAINPAWAGAWIAEKIAAKKGWVCGVDLEPSDTEDSRVHWILGALFGWQWSIKPAAGKSEERKEDWTDEGSGNPC